MAYPYTIYPLALMVCNRLAQWQLPPPDPEHQPTISVICPVHDEAELIARKVSDLLASDYPQSKLEILVVGDGCTDNTLEIAERVGGNRLSVIPLARRAGKAAALNAGVERAKGEILVFTDVGIQVENCAFTALAGRFSDPKMGCVSGEDRVADGGSEGLYGRFELFTRREEAKWYSIAGASGCLYAVRRDICGEFVPGMAPDFLSVIQTVERGFRASCEPAARGVMASTNSQSAEFLRKTRTLLRGMTTLFGNPKLLNPFRYPRFSFILISHKVMRWVGPAALIGCLAAAVALREQPVYAIALFMQLSAYVAGAIGLTMPSVARRHAFVRVPAYFLLVNAAAATSLVLWIAGVRREIWEPTKRTSGAAT